MRQQEFLRRLSENGSVQDACAAVGLSTTSAYRAQKRMPEFAAAWEGALQTIQPVLKAAAFERAVNGWEEPILHAGKVVAHKRRYSDALLKMLMQREPVAGAAVVEAAPEKMKPARRGKVIQNPVMTPAELTAELEKRFEALNRRLAREAAEGSADEPGDA